MNGSIGRIFRQFNETQALGVLSRLKGRLAAWEEQISAQREFLPKDANPLKTERVEQPGELLVHSWAAYR